MHVGLALPQFDFSVPGRTPLPYEDVLQWARAAEEHGLDSVWLADHVFWSIEKYGGPPGTHSALDPIAALAGVARATRRARLGTLVLCAPLRPAAVAAKALATLDVVAGGRLDVGVGAGWYEPEFHAAGIPFERPAVRPRRPPPRRGGRARRRLEHGVDDDRARLPRPLGGVGAGLRASGSRPVHRRAQPVPVRLGRRGRGRPAPSLRAAATAHAVRGPR